MGGQSQSLETRIAQTRRKIALSPANPVFYNQLGIMLGARGEITSALQAFDSAIERCATFAEAWVNRATTLEALGQTSSALTAAMIARQLTPSYAEAQSKIQSLAATLGQAATYSDPWAPRSRVTSLLRRLKASRQDGNACESDASQTPAQREAQLRARLAKEPHDVACLAQLSELLSDWGRLAEAESFARHALNFSGDAAPALALSLEKQGRVEDAVSVLESARSAANSVSALAPTLLRLRLATCNWSGIDRLWRDAIDCVRADFNACDPFTALSIMPAPADHQSCANAYKEKFFAHIHRLVQPRRPARSKLRIGYMSADFHQHAVATLIAELFSLHDRKRFDVFGYGLWLEDDSIVGKRIRRSFDRYATFFGASDRAAAERVAADEIDILIDLTAYTLNGRPGILAHRPAPIQVNFLGYPGTHGAGLCDYIIGDRTVTPAEHARWFNEKIVTLPDAYQVNDRQRPKPARSGTPDSHGLPSEHVTYCNFNNVNKITPGMFSLWMKILTRVPKSVLWLLSGQTTVQRNLRTTAERLGVYGQRIVFANQLPHADHLGRYHHADVFLDTTPYNAHTTCSEALWMGCPVVTQAGDTFAGRVAASLLGAVGLPQLVTQSTQDYEELAVELGIDPKRRRNLRAHLEKDSVTLPLFDTPRFARHLEDAYQQMWSIHQAGQSPRPIVINR